MQPPTLNVVHKNFVGVIRHNTEDGKFYGNVQTNEGTLTFDGNTPDEAKDAFVDTVETYLREPSSNDAGKGQKLTPADWVCTSPACIEIKATVEKWMAENAPDVPWTVNDEPKGEGIYLRLPSDPAGTFLLNKKPDLPLGAGMLEGIKQFLWDHTR